MATQGSYNGHEHSQERKEAGEKKFSTGGGRNIREYRAKEGNGSGEARSYKGGNGPRTRDNQGSNEYRRRDNRNFRSNDTRDGRESRDGRDARGRDGQSQGSGYKPRDSRSGGYRPRDNRNSYGGGYNNFTKDKDDDDGRQVYRPKPKAPEKAKDPQPDKFETIKRLEREQKTIKKKESKRNKAESNRPQQKQKRQNNRNLLNDYANGMYDDYEDDFE